MKQKGYLLIYVVIVLGFVGIVFLYAAERLRLATLVEERRFDALRTDIAIHNDINELLGAESDLPLDVLKAQVNMGKLVDQDHERTVTTRNGRTFSCDIRVQKEISVMNWTIVNDNNQKLFIQQKIYAPMDATAEEGGMPLSEKMNRLEKMMKKEDLPLSIEENDLRIRWNEEEARWDLFTVSEAGEDSDSEDPEPSDSESDETEGASDQPKPALPTGDEENEARDEEKENPSDAGTEPREDMTEDATGSSETEPKATTEFVGSLAADEPLYLIHKGKLSIEAGIKKPPTLSALICIRGSLSVQGVNVRGIVLHEGEAVPSNKTAQIHGYYESDRKKNSESVPYRENRLHWLRIGLPISDFVTFQNGPIRKEAPRSFPN